MPRIRVKGPKVQQAFAADGKPAPQATGFAGKYGLTVEQLEKEVGGVEHLFANVTVVGKPAQVVFQEIGPGLVSNCLSKDQCAGALVN